MWGLYDVALESPLFDTEIVTAEGHKVQECHVYLKGVCKDCFLKNGKLKQEIGGWHEMPQMIIPDDLKKIFEKVDSVVFETAGKERNQTAVQVFWKKVLNDQTVLLIGDFTKLNEKDLIEDNYVRISYGDPEEEKGYQIKGIGRYHTDGSIYELGRKVMLTKKHDSAPEGVIEVEVTGISIMRPGPCYYRR